MASLSEGTQEKLQKLQMLEHSLQNFLLQKQQFQAQLIETDSALEELSKTDVAYKIIGNIMISSKKDEIKKELEEKQKTVTLRIKSVEKQEEKLREQMSSLQSEVLKGMDGK